MSRILWHQFCKRVSIEHLKIFTQPYVTAKIKLREATSSILAPTQANLYLIELQPCSIILQNQP